MYYGKSTASAKEKILKREGNVLGALQSIVVVVLMAVIVSPILANMARPEAQQLDRYHRIAIATSLYTEASDGVLPIAVSYTAPSGPYRYNVYIAVPAGWTSGSNRHIYPRRAADASTVYNSILAYGGNAGVFAEEAFPDSTVFGFDREKALRSPMKVNVRYNGLLHSYPVDAVTAPDQLTMFYQAYRENVIGFQVSSPTLNCPDPQRPCRFDPMKAPQGVNNFQPGSLWYGPVDRAKGTVWLYGHSMVFLSVNGSLDVREINLPTQPDLSRDTDRMPWTSFEQGGQGHPYSTWLCQPQGAQAGYDFYFRPDHSFTGFDHCP